jgi:hypothetical protein
MDSKGLEQVGGFVVDFTVKGSFEYFTDNFAIVFLDLLTTTTGITQDDSLFDGHTGNLVNISHKINKGV